MSIQFLITFSEHMSAEAIMGLRSSLMNSGLVTYDEDRKLKLVPTRPRQIKHVQIMLGNWERLGWLRWSEDELS